MDNVTVLILCLTAVACLAIYLLSRTGELSSKLATIGTLLAKLIPVLRQPVGLLVCFDVFIDHDDTTVPEHERIGEGQEVRYAHRFVLAENGIVHFGTLTLQLAEREGGTIVFRHVSPIFFTQQIDGAPAGMVLDLRTQISAT